MTRIKVKRGSLYLSKEDYDRYFAGLEAVILLGRDGGLLVLPVRHAASGGYLLKLRNGAGDRVVNAPDFFREHGVADDCDLNLKAVWDSNQAGLFAKNAFDLQT